MPSAEANGKIILFGEYAVLSGIVSKITQEYLLIYFQDWVCSVFKGFQIEGHFTGRIDKTR